MRYTKDILIAWKNTHILNRMGTKYPSKSAGIDGTPRDFDYRQYQQLSSIKILGKRHADMLRTIKRLEYSK